MSPETRSRSSRLRALAPAGLLLLLGGAEPGSSGVSGASGASGASGPAGPDVTVYELTDIANNGSVAGLRGYSIGTTSCNVGDAPVN